jgi:hypothetical protein
MSNLGTCSKCVHVDAQPCGVDLFRDTLTITDGKIVGCCDHYRPVAPTPEPVTKRHELDERVERDHPLVEDAEKFLHNVVGMYHEQVPLAFPAALQHIRDLLAVVGEMEKRQHQSDLNYDALEKQNIYQGEKIRHQREELSKWNSERPWIEARERVAVKERDAALLEVRMLRDLAEREMGKRNDALDRLPDKRR